MRCTRLVNKPRKVYHCYACGGEICSAHLYIVSVIDGEFYYGRFHITCDARIDSMCGKCKRNGNCESSLKECFYDKYIRSNK